MYKKDILRIVVKKAEENGFKLSNKKHAIAVENNIFGFSPEEANVVGFESIIFDHDFAKAFWGEESILEEYPLSDGSGEYLKILMPAWQANLRKMVLEEDPIKYLERFFKKE